MRWLCHPVLHRIPGRLRNVGKHSQTETVKHKRQRQCLHFSALLLCDNRFSLRNHYCAWSTPFKDMTYATRSTICYSVNILGHWSPPTFRTSRPKYPGKACLLGRPSRHLESQIVTSMPASASTGTCRLAPGSWPPASAQRPDGRSTRSCARRVGRSSCRRTRPGRRQVRTGW
jgi:hypothetical protein